LSINQCIIFVNYLFFRANGKREWFDVLLCWLLSFDFGCRVQSEKQTLLKEFMQKGFVMDDERLKNPDGRPDYNKRALLAGKGSVSSASSLSSTISCVSCSGSDLMYFP
jgi:hypothetical protein